MLDPGPTPMVSYRAGAVTSEAIEAACGVPVVRYVEVAASPGRPEGLPSPGVGLRHYAPEAEVRLTAGTPEALWTRFFEEKGKRSRVGVLLPGDWEERSGEEAVIERWGRWDDPTTLAAGLFAGLRALERRGVEVVVCPLPEPGGVLDAVRDRLEKAQR